MHSLGSAYRFWQYLRDARKAFQKLAPPGIGRRLWKQEKVRLRIPGPLGGGGGTGAAADSSVAPEYAGAVANFSGIYFLAQISEPIGNRALGLSVSSVERKVAKAPSSAPVRSVVLAAISARR